MKYDYLYALFVQMNHLNILFLGFYWHPGSPSPSLPKVGLQKGHFWAFTV